MENRYCFPLKLSVPSPQLTPMPAAIEVLSIATFPEGLGLCAAMAVVANATKRTSRAKPDTVRTFNIQLPPRLFVFPSNNEISFAMPRVAFLCCEHLLTRCLTTPLLSPYHH